MKMGGGVGVRKSEKEEEEHSSQSNQSSLLIASGC